MQKFDINSLALPLKLNFTDTSWVADAANPISGFKGPEKTQCMMLVSGFSYKCYSAGVIKTPWENMKHKGTSKPGVSD